MLSGTSGTRQFGGGAEVVYAVAGYGALRSPLLPANGSRYLNSAGDLCFSAPVSYDTGPRGADCIHSLDNLASQKSLSIAANTPYAFLAVEGKGNAKPHAEIDFGSLIWTAWGMRFLSEHGYGTISSLGTTQQRYAQVDNNPAGSVLSLFLLCFDVLCTASLHCHVVLLPWHTVWSGLDGGPHVSPQSSAAAQCVITLLLVRS